MTLDEAIAHAEEVATTICDKCAKEHRQLAEWLRELKRLKAENAKLRELAGKQVLELEDENAELRELVCDLYRCDDESCTHCKYWNQSDEFYCNLGVGWKARRMRELGIEVDG